MTIRTHRVLWSSAAILVAIAAVVRPSAQTRSPVAPSDYAQWETLAVQPRATSTGPLSPDGRFLVYGITRQNRNNELRVVEIASGRSTVLALGEQPSFSADSKWLGYAIGVPEAEEERLQKARKPVRRKAGVLNLSTGETTSVADIESFAFSASGLELAMRTYPPEPAGPQGSDAPAPPDDPDRDKAGSSLIVRDLASGIDTAFGNVTEYAWQTKGPLLAFTIGVDGRRGNGVHLYNPATASLRVLDSGDAAFSNLSWRKDADDLAVLRSKSDKSREGDTHLVLAWRGLERGAGERHTLDPTTAAVLAADRRVVSYRKPEWSKDGGTLFIGLAEWFEATGETKPAEADEAAGVDVWHWKDVDVMPVQKKRIATDRQRNLLAAWHLEPSALVPLARGVGEEVRPLENRAAALVIDQGAHAMDRSIGRPFADVALVDTHTGVRTAIKERIEDRYVQSSPDGRYVLYLLDDHYWIYDVAMNAHRNLSKSIATSFVDQASDATVAQKPAFGLGGWTTASASLLLYDEYDVWEVGVATASAVRLTDGAEEQVRYRVVSLAPDEKTIDRGKPLYLSAFGRWTKRSGYARLASGAARPERPVWLDGRVRALAKAKDADVFAYVVESFDNSPDYLVAGPALADARPVTETNPQQANFAWGRAEIVEYKNARGERTQGALFYPAGFEAGKRYPMIVYMYERLSDSLHTYVSPSERAPYNASVFTAHGYFFFTPDIVFKPREPGVSVIDAVVPGVKAVVQKARSIRHVWASSVTPGAGSTPFISQRIPTSSALLLPARRSRIS